jgi:glycosyltransferase involved in cell wall biosynthesis
MSAASTPVKIVYVAISYGRSGTEQIILELSERFVRDGASVTVVIPTGSEGLDRMAEEARELGASVERVAPLYPGDRDPKRNLYDLYHLFRRWRPSIVHFHIPRALSGFESILAARLARVPRRIRTDHNPVVSRPIPLEQLRLRIADSMVDRIVLVSTDNLTNHREQFGRPAGKCLMIPNGVDPNAIVCCRPPERRRLLRVQLGLPPDDQIAVMVAALQERKGAFDYIKAAHAASKMVPSLRYAVLGEGDILPVMQRMAAEFGIIDRVHFLGRRDDVRQILHAFDQFVLPSHYEGMALTMLEALAAGLPMVTTRVGGVSDVLPAERGALFADRYDAEAIGLAMARLATDAGLRAQLSAVSRERVRRDFTIEAVYRRYRSLYAQLGVLAA